MHVSRFMFLIWDSTGISLHYLQFKTPYFFHTDPLRSLSVQPPSETVLVPVSCSLLEISTSQIHPYMLEPESDQKYESGQCLQHMEKP